MPAVPDVVVALPVVEHLALVLRILSAIRARQVRERTVVVDPVEERSDAWRIAEEAVARGWIFAWFLQKGAIVDEKLVPPGST